MMRKKFILLGYGNPDRGDDGAAFYLLKELIKKFSSDENAITVFQEAGFLELTPEIDLWFNLQLYPELSQDLAEYEHAIFIDAHTAEIPDPLLIQEIKPGYKNSPFTHHLTPSSCLELAEILYQHAPHATLVTVRGYAFDFSRELSVQTKSLVDQALQVILEMLR